MTEEITIQEYQNMVDEWIQTMGIRYYSELTNMAILTEEVGEVARIMSRTYGEQSFKSPEKKQDLADELADVLFVLTCIANQTGTDLTEAIRKNLKKRHGGIGNVTGIIPNSVILILIWHEGGFEEKMKKIKGSAFLCD